MVNFRRKKYNTTKIFFQEKKTDIESKIKYEQETNDFNYNFLNVLHFIYRDLHDFYQTISSYDNII